MINNPKELLQKVEDDIANGKGCFIGCLRHSDDHSSGGPLDAPEWAYYLWDKIHEGLLARAIEDNYRKQVTAVVNAQIPSHDDKRWVEIYHALMARMLRRCVARINDAVVIKAIEQVVAYHENPNRTEKERIEVRSAAWEAEWSDRADTNPEERAAAWAAVRSAARSAVWTSESAAESAEKSKESARAVEYQQIADDFAELLEAK